MNKGLISVFMVFLLSMGGCKDNNNPGNEEIPNVPVNLVINMDMAAYMQLAQQGQWMYFEGGSKGIIVYHSYNDEFVALERNCPYNPLNACSRVEVEDNNIYMRCGETVNGTFKQCCGSRFQLPEGFFVSGPTQRSLKTYYVVKDGNILTVTN